MNKFEQVSIDGAKMSLAVSRAAVEGGPMSDVWKALWSEVQCIMANGHMGTPCLPGNRQIYTSENITSPPTSLSGGNNLEIFWQKSSKIFIYLYSHID